MSTERWIFLFEAIIAACALAAFFRIDAMTIAGLWRKGAAAIPTSRLQLYTRRDVVIACLVFATLLSSGLGFYVSRDTIPHLSESQKRTLLSSVTPIRTVITSVPVAITNNDAETEPLAHDIAAIFNRSGIEPIMYYTSPDNSDQTGIIICIKDLNKPPRETEPVKAAFSSSGIEFKVQRFPDRGFSGTIINPGVNQELVIWIAPAPI